MAVVASSQSQIQDGSDILDTSQGINAAGPRLMRVALSLQTNSILVTVLKNKILVFRYFETVFVSGK